MSRQTSSVSARTTDTKCLRSSSLVVCGMLDRRALLPGHREIGGVGARLRQRISGKFVSIAAAGRSALQDDPRVDAEEEHQAENDEKAENADAAAAGPSRRSESATPPPGKGKPKPPPSSRRSSTFSLSLSPRQRMASLTSMSGQNRPLFQSLCMGRAAAQGPCLWRGGTPWCP